MTKAKNKSSEHEKGPQGPPGPEGPQGPPGPPGEVISSEKNDLQPVDDIEREYPLIALVFSVLMSRDIRLDDLLRRVSGNPTGDIDMKLVKLARKRFERAARTRGWTLKEYLSSIEKFLITLIEAIKD